jgi:hypothetical protein
MQRSEADDQRAIVTVTHDFAAAMQITQAETLCAQHAPTHHLYVASVSWNARRVRIPDAKRQARTTINRPITHSLIRDTLLCYAYSEHDQNVRLCVFGCMRVCMCASKRAMLDAYLRFPVHRRIPAPAVLWCSVVPPHHPVPLRAVIHAQADFVYVSLLVIIGFLCTGRVLPEFGELGVEAFFNGKRVRGSSKNLPLRSGLADEDPTNPPVILVVLMHLLRLLNDGCSAQFGSMHAHLWLQVRL